MNRATTTFFVLFVLATPARAGECREVRGKFASMPAPTCASPVGLCTAGSLSGDLTAGYGFVMSQILPTGEPSIPTVSFFTGASTITFRRGTITGTDAGALDLNPVGRGDFSTLITVTGGTGAHAGASGYLQVRGRLDFFTGGASGRYVGLICSP